MTLVATRKGQAAPGTPSGGKSAQPAGRSTSVASETEDQRKASWSCARFVSAFQVAWMAAAASTRRRASVRIRDSLPDHPDAGAALRRGVYASRASGVVCSPRRRPGSPRGRRARAVEPDTPSAWRTTLMSHISRRTFLGTAGLTAAGVATGPWVLRAHAQAQTIKIGTLYDHTGPFSAAGSLNCWRGAKMIIDVVNEKGGVLGKYKIVRVDGDSQSKAEVAINEAERLLNVEKVDVLAGIYSSAHAVPLAEKVDKQKRFCWITTAISDAVFQGRNLQYTFRPQPHGGQFGAISVQYIAAFAQEKLKADPKGLRVAIIYEDGPYGTNVATAN